MAQELADQLALWRNIVEVSRVRHRGLPGHVQFTFMRGDGTMFRLDLSEE